MCTTNIIFCRQDDKNLCHGIGVFTFPNVNKYRAFLRNSIPNKINLAIDLVRFNPPKIELVALFNAETRTQTMKYAIPLALLFSGRLSNLL